MDQERERIQADLRGLLDGDVQCGEVFVQMYATDASVYEIPPVGVVRPRGLSDVVATVQYAAENHIPLHARGAGTGLAGESLGSGLILDFSHSMRRILTCDAETVRLQPGVVCAQLGRFLADRGRIYGPDPAMRNVSTMGGILAIDGSGSHWMGYGAACDTIESLQLVLADGSVIEVDRRQLETTEGRAPAEGRRRQLERQLADLFDRESAVIDAQRSGARLNRSGYALRETWDGQQIDLGRLMAGSEGTLALITEATLRTAPQPASVGVALLFFDRLESAARGAIEIAGLGASACDLMDRRLLSIARESDPRYELLIPRSAEASLLVEMEGRQPNETREKLRDLVSRIQRKKRLAFDARVAMDREEVDLYWQLSRRVVPGLYGLKGSSRPLPFVEDIAIPPDSLPDFLVQLQNVLKNHQVTASLFAHAGHGQLHVRPFLDLGSPADIRTMQDLATDLYQQVLRVGGTISGEHGDGLSRTWFVRQQYGPLYDVFRQVKRLFDPDGIFNPGKKVSDSPQPLTHNLRPVVRRSLADDEDRDSVLPGDGSSSAQPIPLQLRWPGEGIVHAARNCNGCGGCRTQLPDERMCPIFRYGPREEATPRAKANLVRAIFTGRLGAEHLAADDLKDIADLCIHCHQCRLECPAGVDIPKLMVECKAQYVATNGLRPSDWVLINIHRFLAWASRFHRLANWAIANRQMRWILEQTLGIAQGRKLPRVAHRSFMRHAQRRKLTRPTRRSGAKVLYFVDVYANWHDVQLADALIAVMEHNGVSVYVAPGQIQSGMAAISMGAVDAARRMAQQNVHLLAEAVRQGYHVVTTEPAAAVCLTHEYLQILDDDDAQLVADNTSECCHYLWRRHLAGKLELDFSPVNASVGYHLPCHVRALGHGTPGYNLLRLVPGLAVHTLGHACSGMAGTFGLKRSNYRSSLRAGWGLISHLRSDRVQVGTTECSACKMQMEQGTTKPTIHPLKLLALSYGLLPDLAGLLTTRGEDLVVT